MNKSLELLKLMGEERYPGTTFPMGWINPNGKIFLMGDNDIHHLVLLKAMGKRKNTGDEEDLAYRDGWISFGHAGDPVAVMSSTTFKNMGSPAMSSLRHLAFKSDDPVLEIRYSDRDDNFEIVVAKFYKGIVKKW